MHNSTDIFDDSLYIEYSDLPVFDVDVSDSVDSFVAISGFSTRGPSLRISTGVSSQDMRELTGINCYAQHGLATLKRAVQRHPGMPGKKKVYDLIATLTRQVNTITKISRYCEKTVQKVANDPRIKEPSVQFLVDEALEEHIRNVNKAFDVLDQFLMTLSVGTPND